MRNPGNGGVFIALTSGVSRLPQAFLTVIFFATSASLAVQAGLSDFNTGVSAPVLSYVHQKPTADKLDSINPSVLLG